jgi:flagellar biosynthesis protein FlhB
MEYKGGSYEQLMKIQFGKWGYWITSWVLVINQLCTCIANVLFIVNFLDFIFCQHHINSLCGEKYLYTLYA